MGIYSLSHTKLPTNIDQVIYPSELSAQINVGWIRYFDHFAAAHANYSILGRKEGMHNNIQVLYLTWMESYLGNLNYWYHMDINTVRPGGSDVIIFVGYLWGLGLRKGMRLKDNLCCVQWWWLNPKVCGILFSIWIEWLLLQASNIHTCQCLARCSNFSLLLAHSPRICGIFLCWCQKQDICIEVLWPFYHYHIIRNYSNKNLDPQLLPSFFSSLMTVSITCTVTNKQLYGVLCCSLFKQNVNEFWPMVLYHCNIYVPVGSYHCVRRNCARHPGPTTYPCASKGVWKLLKACAISADPVY